MPHLHSKMLARDVGDPIINGYTRTARGIKVYRSSGAVLKAYSTNEVQTEPIASYGRTFNAIVTQKLISDTPFGDKQALAGIQLGNVLFQHSLRGANGGPDLYIGGAFVSNIQTLGNRHTLKTVIAANGDVTAYLDENPLLKLSGFGGSPGTAYDYLQHTINPPPEAVAAYFQALCVCADNSVRFAKCPANGFVDVYIGAEAKQTVTLDANGAGSLDFSARSFPLRIVYDIQDATHASKAVITIPQSGGGDVIGLR